MLGHGAGGGVEASDLLAATDVALEAGLAVARVEQPYRVAGRKAPAPQAQVDAAWIAVARHLRERLSDPVLIAGGRSFGARVACRTARETQARAVLCLAFPEHPPGRPEKTRQPELDAVRVPVLVVQGQSDPFGMPVSSRPEHEIVAIKGNHSLKSDIGALRDSIGAWLPRVL